MSSLQFVYAFSWLSDFYARQYAIARICYRPSVCPSVKWVDHTKTVEVRMIKFSPYGSPNPSSFCVGKFHPEILRGSRAGASNKGGVGKISIFLSSRVNISKTVADTAKVINE